VFARWARKQGVTDRSRKLPATIVLAWIFLYGFAKNERENIDQKEERDLKRVAGVLLGLDRTALGRVLEAGEILEVEDG
jgi:hypothetical protein